MLWGLILKPKKKDLEACNSKLHGIRERRPGESAKPPIEASGVLIMARDDEEIALQSVFGS